MTRAAFFLRLSDMGYVFSFQDALAYDKWFQKPQNKYTAELECQLMQDMLRPVPGESVLDIGCGTGQSICSLLNMGLQVTGLDPSPYMLDIAFQNSGNRVEYYRGFAEDLPFEDNSFNHACFMTTLEFVDDPQKAIEEACRVSKDRIFIGVLNRYAFKGIQRRVKGIFSQIIYNHARFFSVWELKNLVRSVLGEVPITWRTICQLPSSTGKIAQSVEAASVLQRFPFGAFAGTVVTLVPRFRTRPLSMRYQAKHTGGAPAL